jgi:hypothetical protein
MARAGGFTLRYAQGMEGRLQIPVTVTLPDGTIEDSLRAVLAGHALTFRAMGPRTAFIYPDTPASRDKYTASVRAFPLAKAESQRLMNDLNGLLKPTFDGFRAMVLTVSDQRTLVVYAVPEQMTWIAAWIAQNDK